jgi:DHA1 family bicyclomycin/chloramphenicol resistance-like MFS transporter
MHPLRANTLSLLAILTAILVAGEMAIDMFLSSLPTLTEWFGVGTARVQLTLSVYLVGFALAQLAYGPISDRYGRKGPLIFGMVLFVLASAACALATSIEMLIVFRFFQALGGAAGFVICLAIIRDLHDRDQAATMLARMGTVIGISPAIAPIIGGYLLIWFGWQANFYFLTLWGVLGLLLIYFFVNETNTHLDVNALKPRAVFRNFGTMLRNRTYLGFTFALVFSFSTFFAFLSGSPFVLIEVLQVAPENFAWLVPIQVVGFIAGTMLADRLMPKLGIDVLFRNAVFLAAVSGVTVGVLPYFGIHSVFGIIAPMVVFAFAMGFIFPLGTAGAIGPFPLMAGAASALLGFLESAVGASFGILVGIMHDDTVVPMTTIMGITSALALMVYLVTLWRRPAETGKSSDSRDRDDSDAPDSATIPD